MTVYSQAFAALMSCLIRVMVQSFKLLFISHRFDKYPINFIHIWPFKFPFLTPIFIVIIFEWLNQWLVLGLFCYLNESENKNRWEFFVKKELGRKAF